MSIDAFWKWFEEHRKEFEVLVDSTEPFWDTALEKLKQLDPQLWFELSLPNDDDREFIITVEGHTDLFPLVDSIIAQAPALAGWQFVALKPPQGFAFVSTYEGIRFEPRSMWFLPLENPSCPSDFGMLVGVPNFTNEFERQASNAVALILETGLGERAAALDIQHVEVSELPENPEAAGYIELFELADYIAWRQRKNSES